MTGGGAAVLVVGAGPVGLVAACELARQGLRPRLIDQRDSPNDLSRAVIVHARSQEMLDALGVLDRVQARARRIESIQVFSGLDSRQPLIRIELAGLPTRRPCGLDLPQGETEAVLSERAEELGIRVERGTELTALCQVTDGVEVALQSPRGAEQARFAWVVGADGAHSTVRAAVGTQLSGRFRGQRFVFADVDVDTEFSLDALLMFAHPDGIAGLFPMAGDRVRLMFGVPPPPAAAEPTIQQVQHLADARFGSRVHVRAAHWLTYFEVHHGQVPHYRLGRVLLAGDAAHIHSPAGGQGMNTGMQDAANLAWKLALVAHGHADARLLDSYEAERHPVAAAVIRATTALTRIGTATGPAGTARGWVLAAAGHLPRVTGSAAEAMAELTVSYPRSPVVGRVGRGGRHHLSGPPRPVRPGEHAPDVPGLERPDGSPAWIGDLLRQPGHLVLLRTADDGVVGDLRVELGTLGAVARVLDRPTATPAVRPTRPATEPTLPTRPATEPALELELVDPGGAVATAYGIGDDGLAVIRPDGYVGFLATPATPAALQTYLRRLTIEPATPRATPAGR